MLIAFCKIIFGFIALIWAADRLVLGAAALAKKLGVPPLLIGLTIVALGTSAPEICVSVMAAIDGYTGLAIGNAIGSNIVNITLALGITTLIAPLTIKSNLLRREYPIMLAVLLLTGLLLMDGKLDRSDSLVLLIGCAILLIWLIHSGLKHRQNEPLVQEYTSELHTHISTWLACIWFTIGLLLLPISSEYLVQGAISVAHYFAVSDLVIGLTIIAIGTSLPEIATSVVSAIKGEADISVGNILGSNIFNMLLVLAIPGLVNPAPLPDLVFARDFTTMAITSLLFLVLAFNRQGQGVIHRWQGGVLVLCYFIYLLVLLYTHHS